MKSKSIRTLLIAFVVGNSLSFVVFLLLRQFPSFLVIPHIVSIVLLWCLVLWKTNIIALIRDRWKEVLTISALVFVSLLVGLHQVEDITPGMYPDEIGVATWGLKLMQSPGLPPFVGEGYFHPTPLLYLTGISVESFGHTMTAIRLPSIVLGAFAVGLLYILLRLFFPIPIAVAGAVLLIFQYTHIVLSRLAYEPPASLFCQILAFIFLALYWKKRESLYLAGIALSLGLGMYTYLNFRAFAVVVFVVTCLLLWKKQGKNGVFLFSGLIFASIAPLVSYALIDPQGFWGRASEISIFGRNYPPMEFAKELGGNILNTLGFPFIGDPNPGKNPSGVTMFDPFTMVLAVLGLVFLWMKKRAMFWITLLFLLPPVISDILSTEVIPEFHYYGLGHPNALRVSGFIPIVLFAASAGLYWLYLKWYNQRIAETITVGILVIFGICMLNWHWYFNQKENHTIFFVYNYKYNHAKTLKTAKYMNATKAQSVLMTNDLVDNGIARFFLDDAKTLYSFEVSDVKNTMKEIAESDVTAIGLTEATVPIVNELAGDLAKAGYTAEVLTSPTGNPDVVIISKQYRFR